MRQAGSEQIYVAAAQWIDVALRNDGSLFTPGSSVWLSANLEDLYERYNLQPDRSIGAGFDAKLQRQLEGAGDGTLQLMAEVSFVSLLVVDDISGTTKRSSVQKVLSWMEQPVTIPDELSSALDHGLAATGLAWKTWRWVQLAFVIVLARQWKTLPEAERVSALDDPWKFKSALEAVPIQSAYAQREALLHLVFPDDFEDIVARDHKGRIRDAFQNRMGKETSGDVDRDLLAIRTAMSSDYGPGFSFYDPEVSPTWDPVATKKQPWDEFVGWAKKIHAWPGFDGEEYDYKIENGQRVLAALEAASANDEWLPLTETAFKGTNLVRWQAWDNLLDWWKDHPEEGREMLVAIQRSDVSLFARAKGFIDRLPNDLLSGADILRVVSFFFLGVDAHQFPPVAATPLAQACKLTGYPAPSAGVDQARRYRHALAFFDRLVNESAQRGLQLRDRLDAQSIMWAITENDPLPTFSGDERAAFLAWRSGQSVPAPAAGAVKPEHKRTRPRYNRFNSWQTSCSFLRSSWTRCSHCFVSAVSSSSTDHRGPERPTSPAS